MWEKTSWIQGNKRWVTDIEMIILRVKFSFKSYAKWTGPCWRENWWLPHELLKSLTSCVCFMAVWAAVMSESVCRTGQDGTGQAQREHISRTAGGATERCMCASEACISKSDLSCGCLWWCPHGRALRYGTWPLSGPSVWPFLFAASLRRWPAAPASCPRAPSSRPGSPPGTARPPFPAPTAPGASGIHSCRDGGRE